MRDAEGVEFLQWCLPRLGLRWPGFRKVRRQVYKRVARRLEEVNDRLARIVPFLSTEEEACALHQAYALMPTASFSRSILEPAPFFLAVAELSRVTWSDLGSPRRVFETLRRVRSMPPWVSASDLAAS
jgi:hypothetical protein